MRKHPFLTVTTIIATAVAVFFWRGHRRRLEEDELWAAATDDI